MVRHHPGLTRPEDVLPGTACEVEEAETDSLPQSCIPKLPKSIEGSRQPPEKEQASVVAEEDAILTAIETLRMQQSQSFQDLTTLLKSSMERQDATRRSLGAAGKAGERDSSRSQRSLPSSPPALHTATPLPILRPVYLDRFMKRSVEDSQTPSPRQNTRSVVKIVSHGNEEEAMNRRPEEEVAAATAVTANTTERSSAWTSAKSMRTTVETATTARPSTESEALPVGRISTIADSIKRTYEYLVRPVKAQSLEKETSRVMAFEEQERAKRHRAAIVGQVHNSRQKSMVAELTTTMRLKQLITGHSFDLLCAFIVVLHGLVIAAQIDHLYRTRTTAGWLEQLDLFFVILHGAELLLRLWAGGPITSYLGKDRFWNIVDTLIVGISAFHFLIQESGYQGLNLVRSVRALRVVRVVRIVRITRFFKQLRMLVYAIASTLKTCMWTMLMMVVVVILFTLLISQSVASHIADHEDALQTSTDEHTQALHHYFGSLEDTALTLFMAIAGGIDWEVAVDPLFVRVDWWVAACFLVYVTFMIICVMNLMTGIFVESAIEAAQSDRENLVQNQLLESAKYKKELTELFQQWDVSGDQQLTLEEFQTRLEEPKVLALYRSLEIDPHDAWSFFKLLDNDGSGFVDLEEFIAGCMRLKGKATGFHMERIAYENRWLMEMLAKLSADVEQLSTRISKPGPGPRASAIQD